MYKASRITGGRIGFRLTSEVTSSTEECGISCAATRTTSKGMHLLSSWRSTIRRRSNRSTSRRKGRPRDNATAAVFAFGVRVCMSVPGYVILIYMRFFALKLILLNLLLVPFYFFADREIALLPTDKLDTLLLFVGLIVIAPITSNFVYNYKNAIGSWGITWGHITTFLSMLVVGMLFIALDVLLVQMIGNVFVFRLALIIFWLAVIAFDIADFLGIERKAHN